MKVLLLMGSMRKKGNTAEVCHAFTSYLESLNVNVETVTLIDRDIKPCIGCGTCQNVLDGPGCIHTDDVVSIMDKILACDAFIFATPIYSWYCTTPVKSLMDRLVYMMNKYYGKEKGDSFWAGKKIGAITTCGYPDHYGADLFITGLKRYAKHSNLIYSGHLNARDDGSKQSVLTDEVNQRLIEFAEEFTIVLPAE